MNYPYELLSDPNLSLEFIEENLTKFNKAEFNILSIFNKHITKEFVEKYDSYPWAHSFHQINLMTSISILPIDYNELKKQNKQVLYDKFEKIEIKEDPNGLNKHRHIKKI